MKHNNRALGTRHPIRIPLHSAPTIEKWLEARAKWGRSIYDGTELRRITERYRMSPDDLRKMMHDLGWVQVMSGNNVCVQWKAPKPSKPKEK